MSGAFLALVPSEGAVAPAQRALCTVWLLLMSHLIPNDIVL